MHPMSFHEGAIPGRAAQARNGRSRNIVRRGRVVDRIPKSRSKPGAVRTMLGYNLEIQFVEVEQPDKTFAAESFVPHTRIRQRHPAIGQEGCRRLSEHGIETHAIGSQLANVERVAASNESAVRVAAVQHVRIAIGRTQHRHRKTSAVVSRVAQPFHTNLVVAELAENIAVADRNEMVEVVSATTGG